MRLGSQTNRESIFQGVIQGTRVWAIYAIVECWFLSILAWISTPNYDYIPLHWGFSVLLAFLYLIIGSIAGGISGLYLYLAGSRTFSFQKVQPTEFFQASITFTIVFAFALNLIIQYIDKLTLHLLPPLAISLLLTFTLALSAISNIWFKRLLFLSNPWTISVLLLGLPWVTHELLLKNTRIIQALSSLVYFLAILLISFCIQKMGQTRRLKKSVELFPPSHTPSLLLPILALMLVLGISFFLRQVEPSLGVRALKLSTPDLSRPNVILISMDTVRADHLSIYGYVGNTTPRLKELSQEASLYTNAIAPGDTTISTMASVFTGLYARKHGAHNDVPDYP